MRDLQPELIRCSRFRNCDCGLRFDRTLPYRSKMAGIFGSLAECGATPRVPVDLTASFRGSKVCRVHTSPVSPRPERVCPFMTAAIAAGVKLPPTHVEASARALEQLRQTQNVNSAFLTNRISQPAITEAVMEASATFFHLNVIQLASYMQDPQWAFRLSFKCVVAVQDYACTSSAAASSFCEQNGWEW